MIVWDLSIVCGLATIAAFLLRHRGQPDSSESRLQWRLWFFGRLFPIWLCCLVVSVVVTLWS
jgi:hypothetical protein